MKILGDCLQKQIETQCIVCGTIYRHGKHAECPVCRFGPSTGSGYYDTTEKRSLEIDNNECPSGDNCFDCERSTCILDKEK